MTHCSTSSSLSAAHFFIVAMTICSRVQASPSGWIYAGDVKACLYW